jgi:protein-L-isoaspartate O-methyltransferase
MGAMATRAEREELERFSVRYAQDAGPAAIAAERAALGSDYGATGYTTVAQADLMADRLRLGPGDQLLDIGSGCGWPGLHIARRTRCDVVVTDLTMAGVRRAAERVDADGMDAHAAVAVASGRELPFRPECFDGIVHTDVLC